MASAAGVQHFDNRIRIVGNCQLICWIEYPLLPKAFENLFLSFPDFTLARRDILGQELFE
jgi:hypothetical protein